ncbi:hypothetical protein [Gordonia aquimaris]|uniref:Uncharacterized protein n=1 Tax=Gordonia aquimaris TaxID=2984863 RepID=A0A9X3I2N8_9ACTN|nr:hypothetical protein [Gordonia aquimaris]MCX2962802.1 hypothetical protein [Gordonia aquimaris]
MGEDNEVPREVVLALGAAAVGARAVAMSARLSRSAVRTALRLPVIGPAGRRGLDRLEAEGERVAELMPTVVDLGKKLVVAVVSAIIAEMDLTGLVRDNVDLNEVAAALDIEAILNRVDLDAVIRDRVDLNGAVALVDLDAIAATLDIDAIAARIDIEAILGRVDMIGLADEIIDGVDLPDIIREASTSVTADVMTDVRSTSERADDAVANVVGRILRRRVVDAAQSSHADE